MIWPFKRKPSPTLRVNPESAYHPTELLDSVAGDDGAVAFGPGDDVRVMAQSDSIAGTWAVADSKHRALPIGGQKGSVFLHDGLVGQVRAVGDKTVMVKFPDPIGLVHVKRDDLWNSKPAMARPRWATRQALSLRVAQAIAVPEGLPQLLVDWVDFARKIWSKSPKVQSTATLPRAGRYTMTSGAAPTMVVRIPGNAVAWPYDLNAPRSIEVRIYAAGSRDPDAPKNSGMRAYVGYIPNTKSEDMRLCISTHRPFTTDIAEHEAQHLVQVLLQERMGDRPHKRRPGEPDGNSNLETGLTDPREIYPYLSQQVAALTQLAKKNGLDTVSLTPHEVEQFLLSDTHGRYRAYKEAHPQLWPRVLARFMRELVRAGHTPAGMGTDSLTIPITERYKRVAMPMPTEADLPASWYVKQTTGVTDDDEPEIMWQLYDPEYRYNGQSVPVAALTIVERRPSVWAVSGSFCDIPGGWGAFLYEKALKFVTDRKGWLGSDITVSNSARNVWTKYMDRNDVEKRNRPKEMFPIDSKDSPAVRMMYRFKQKAYLREEDNDGQSAIVAIRVPELLAKDWPDGRGGHDSSPPHVSVVYLGDMRHIPDARDIVSRIVFETVNALPQFEVELEKDVSFFNKDNGDHVAIKKFDATSAENLTQLHDLVKRNLVAAGIPLGEVFEYTPHATLAYQYEPVWPPEMPSPQGSWTVDAVEVWGFDGPDLVFPLRGGGAARTAQVMRTSPRYEPSPAPYYVPSDGYWKGVVNGLGAVVYNSAEWRAGFKYNELGECTWYVIYRLPRGNFIEIDEDYEVSIAKARMRVNRVLANVQHYTDSKLPLDRTVPPPLPEGEWKLPQWEDAAPVAFTKPEYTNVKSIYELEYKWSKLNAVRENGPLADRAERALALWTGQLDKALNKELALMQRIFRAWLDARPNDSDDLTINTRLADKLRAVMVTHATQPIPPEIVSGIFASEPRTIDDILVQLPPRSPIRHVISSEYYTWLSRNKARGDTWKSVESMLRLIDDAQSLPISEKIVVFHRALTTAHNNGRMPEHLYGGGDGMNDRNRDADRVLTHLSNMKIPPEWDAELKELLNLPRGASLRMTLTAGGMLTLYHYAPDDFEGGVLDPSRFGAGTYTSRDLRASDVPRVFFYLNPGDREQWFTGRRLFSAQVPASSIFDIDNGDPKVLDASRTSSGRVDPHELFLNVKGAGYKGIKYDAGGMPLVAYFEPIAVEPVQQEKAAQQQQFGAQPPPLGQSPQPFPQAQQQAQQQSQAQQKPADTGQSSVGLQPLTDPSQKVNNPLMDVGLDSGGQVRVAPPGSGLVTQQVGTINNPGQQLSLKMPATTPAAQQVTDALSGADVGDYQVLIDNAQSGMDVQQLAKSSAKGKKSNKAYLDHDINPITGALEWVLRSPHGVDVRWFGHMKPTPETVEAARRGGIVDRVFESEAETDTDTVGKDEMAQVLFGPMDYESPDDREVAAIEFAHADITPDSQKLLRSKDTWPQRTTYHNDSKVTRQTLDHHDLVSGGVGYSNIMAVMSEATLQEIESYGAWYGLGHDQALMISEESGVPLDRVCAVIALLSPGMKWENNLQAARRMCLGEPLAGSGGAFPMNVLKALRVLRGSSIEKTMATSEKVLPFYETLLSPEKSAEKAVVDRHMFAIWFGDPSVKMVDDPSVRALIQRDVQLAAREWNMPVQAIQAVTWAIWRQRTNIPRPDDELHPNDLDAPPSDYDYDLMKQGEFQASKRLAMPGSFSMDAFDLFGDDGVEAVTEVAPLVIGDQFKLDGKGPVFEVLNAKSGGDQWILVRPSTHKRLAYGGKFNRSTAIVTIYDKAMATIAEGKMTPVTQQGRTAQSAAASIAAWVEGDNSDQRVADFNWNFEQFDIHRLSEMTPAEWKAWFAEEVRVAEDNRLSSLTDGSLITSPIVLTEIDGDITLWDGFHRVGAAFTYGWNTLPAVVGRPHNQSVNVLTAEPVASERNTTRIAMPMPTDADLPKDWKLIQGESGEHYIVLRDSKDQAIANVNFIESTPGHWQVTHSRTRIPGWGNIPRPDDEPHPNEPDAPPSDYDYDLMKQGELQLTAGRYEDVLARYPDRKGLVDFFVNNDPTNWNGPHAANVYLAWMMEQALKNPNGGTADVQSIVETVNWFHRRKEALKPTPQNAHPRDINSWKSVDDLHAALTALGKSRSQKKVEGSKIVGQADGWTFYRVLDQAAACLLAKGTTWCIGADKNNMYDYYEHLGDTYIAIKGNEKWAIHTKRDTLEAARVTSPRNTEPLHTEWGSMWPAAEKVGFSVPMLEFTLDGYSWPDDRTGRWRVYIDDPDAFGEQVWELTAEIDDPFYLDVVHAEFRTANMQNKTAISLFLELCTDVFVKPLGVPGQRRLGNCMDLTGPVATLWALATEVTVNRELQNDTVKDDDNAEVLHTASRRIAMPGVSRDDVVNHFNSINPLKSTGYDPWSRTYEGLEWSGPVEFAVDDDRLEDGGVTGYMRMPKERAIVEQYAERIRAGEKMPALIIVESSRGDLGVADGGHRLEAARLAGLKTVPAYIGLKPNTRISLTAERLPSKSQLWAMLTESLPERAVSKDMAIHDGAYARWQQPYAKYRSTRPVFTGGELDALNDALDLKGDARVSGPREAFDRLTRNARTWDDIARVVKLFNAVPGFESMHIPEHVMLQNLDEQERDWYEQEEAAAQDDKPLSDEERAQLPDDAFDFDPESLSHAASMRTAVRAGDLGIKDLRRWTASNGTWAMLSASQQGSLHQRKLQHRKLLRQLQELGVKPSMIVPVRGRWYENGQERAEQSLWVKGLDFDQAVKLGRQFDQDAVIFKSDDGVVGMYDLRNGRVRVPAQSGDPVFGDEAIDVAQRGPKVPMPGKGYVPSPEDLYTRGRSTSMSVRYDWDDAKSEFVHDLERPLSRADVERLYRKREGAVRTAMPMPTQLPSNWSEQSRQVGRSRLFVVTDAQSKLVAEVKIRPVDDSSRDFYVCWAQAKQDGWGAYCYERALEWVSDQGGTLRSDSLVSDEAAKVWNKYYDRLSDGDIEAQHVWPRDIIRYDHADNDIARTYRTEPALNYAYRKNKKLAMPQVPAEFAQRLRMTLTPDLLKPEWRKKHEQACDAMTGHCYAAAEAAYHALGGAEAGWKPMHIKHEDAPHWYLQHADGTIFDPTASQFQEPPDYAQGRGKGFLTKAPSARARKILERMQPKIAMPLPSQLPAGWRLKAPPTLAGDYYILTPENIPAAWLRLVKPRYSPTEAYVARVENNYADTVPGLGAYLYQHVMDKATREGVWLRSDTQVSDKARGVWKKFHDREDVVKEPRDNLPGDPGSIWKFDPKNLDEDENASTWEPETTPELFHKYKLKIS